MKVSWILFDLGGVLVDWTGPQALRALLPAAAQHSPDSYAQRWQRCTATDRFERGATSPLEFAREFADHWGVALPPDEMLARYVAWLRGFYDGVPALLAGLRPQARLACLSNTNAAHWDCKVGLGVRAEFNFALASHELQLRKPQADIFALALQRLDAAPDQVLYFDDLAPNVAGAHAVGMQAYQVAGLAQLRQQFAALGLPYG
jgi:HAD superfamily hydrolase (TIGR01509 family)